MSSLQHFMSHAGPTKGVPLQPDFFQFARQDKVKELLVAAGFRQINHSDFDCIWHLETADELFRVYSESPVRMAMLLAAQPS